MTNKLPQDIKDLDARINKLKNKKHHKNSKSQTNLLLQQAFRYAAEFISPVIIALILGYFADIFFGTKPIIMLIMAVLGCAAGVLNTYKAAIEVDKDI